MNGIAHHPGGKTSSAFVGQQQRSAVTRRTFGLTLAGVKALPAIEWRPTDAVAAIQQARSGPFSWRRLCVERVHAGLSHEADWLQRICCLAPRNQRAELPRHAHLRHTPGSQPGFQRAGLCQPTDTMRHSWNAVFAAPFWGPRRAPFMGLCSTSPQE